MSQPQASLLGAAPRRTGRGRRDAAAEHHDMSQERWLLTYADMITLLLVLFIVLFALSKINQAKYRQFQQSISHVKLVGTSVVHGTTSVPSKGSAPLSAAAATARLHQIEQALTHALQAKGLLGDVTITIDASGLVEGLVADSTFFVTDSAQLSPLGQEIVDTSGHVLDSYPNNVDVAGYTDDQQITGGPFANNWALSAARSSTVVERLTTMDAVNPARVVAIGYGQYHPVVPNTSPAAEAENRRVNIVVSRQSTPGSSAAL
ncbi:MAG: flagellar motor protein MotB [Acidimicrobiales bacterium]